VPARYNIGPTTTIDGVIERDAKRELVPMRWGLVPSWWKKKAKETPRRRKSRGAYRTLRQVCLARLYVTNNDDGERDFQCEPRQQKRSDFVSHRITPLAASHNPLTKTGTGKTLSA
jgi:putative SOS response-associated peptidase YedK